MLAPVGVPSTIVAKLNSEIADILSQRESVRRLEVEGIVTSALSSAAFSRTIAAEIEKWRRIAREADISGD